MSSNLIECFSKLQDPRDEKNRRYPLEEILFLCVSAVVSGAEGWEAIERFGQAKLDWLRRFLPMTQGIPSHDTIAWLMARLPPKRFQSCFVEWVQSLSQDTQGEIISIDGKTARRSYDTNRSLGAIHRQLALGQRRINCLSVKSQPTRNRMRLPPFRPYWICWKSKAVSSRLMLWVVKPRLPRKLSTKGPIMSWRSRATKDPCMKPSMTTLQLPNLAASPRFPANLPKRRTKLMAAWNSVDIG